MNRYQIGHPAYGGANAPAECKTKKELYKILRQRGVDAQHARALCKSIGGNGIYDSNYLATYANEGSDVVEVKTNGWWK